MGESFGDFRLPFRCTMQVSRGGRCMHLHQQDMCSNNDYEPVTARQNIPCLGAHKRAILPLAPYRAHHILPVGISVSPSATPCKHLHRRYASSPTSLGSPLVKPAVGREVDGCSSAGSSARRPSSGRRGSATQGDAGPAAPALNKCAMHRPQIIFGGQGGVGQL